MIASRLRAFALAALTAAGLLSSIAAGFAQPAPVPALPDVERRTSYSISASLCSCNVGFALFGDSTDVANWIEVFINGALIPQSGNWTLSSPSGPLANLSRPITNAVLTFTVAQTGTVQIVGARRPRRTTQFGQNVAARDLNQAITDIVAMLRENWDKTNDVTGRAVLAPPGETLALLPVKASRINQGACFDNNGYLTSCVAVASSTFIAGNGISFTGTNPTTITNNIAAGSNVTISGTNPLTIAVPLAAGPGIVLSGSNPLTIGAPFIPSRAAAIALNLSTFTTIQTSGYATGGDGGGARYVQSASQPFCGSFANTAAFQDAGGTWWNIAEAEYNVKQFGAKFDWLGVDGTATDDTAAVQSAINCAGMINSIGDDVGGGAGRIVRIPPASSMISSAITVRNQAQIIGSGPINSVFVMKASFTASAHFFMLGDQFTQTDIAAPQSRGSAGNLVINGNLVRSGAAYFLQPLVPAVYSASNNSGVNFTFIGTDRFGNAQSETIAGPTAGSSSSSAKFWLSITQVSVNVATVVNVSVGFPQLATFTTRLQDLQLFSALDNATQFATNINLAAGPISGNLGNAMIYSNSVQHTAGLKNVKVFAGNRNAVLFETGVGGASTLVFQDVETFNHGNCGGCASNNAQIYLAYLGLQTPIDNLVVVGPGASGGGAAAGIYVLGGFVSGHNIHCEGVATCVVSDIHNANNGFLLLQSVFGGGSMNDMIKIAVGSPANINYFSGLSPNGATRTVNNQGVNTSGIIIPWTLY